MSETKKPAITLLTCTHNGSRTLQRALEAIAKQTDISKESFEVLIVDNASIDNTFDIAIKTIQELGIKGRVIQENRPGKLYAFITGISKAQGDLVSIIDDDNLIEPGFIKYTLDVFLRYPQVGIVGSKNRVLTEHPLPSWFNWTCNSYACSQPWLEQPHHQDQEGIITSDFGIVSGAGSTFRVKPILDCLEGGYQFFEDTRPGKTIAGEDLEICYLLNSCGYSFAYDPRIQIRHAIKEERLNLDSFKALCNRIGSASLAIDPFMFSHKSTSKQFSWKWTWQWQLISKVKRYYQLSSAPLFKNFDEKEKFLNWREKTICLGAIQRILAERENYSQYIHQVAAGSWTELRDR